MDLSDNNKMNVSISRPGSNIVLYALVSYTVLLAATFFIL